MWIEENQESELKTLKALLELMPPLGANYENFGSFFRIVVAAAGCCFVQGTV